MSWIYTEACSPAVARFLASASWVQALACTSVTPAVSYLPTRLVGCSVDPGISRGVRKLTRTPRITKTKKHVLDFTFFFN